MSAVPAGDGEGFWADVEQLIEQSPLEWTFLRPTGFATNTLIWKDQIQQRVVRWPYGKAGRSLIHERDIAAVAVHALTEYKHAGRKYLLTGPEVITQADQVRIIGEVIDRAVRWEELSREQAREQMLANWSDASFVDRALDTWAEMVESPEPVTSTVEEITGTPARTFREWVSDHKDDFHAP